MIRLTRDPARTARNIRAKMEATIAARAKVNQVISGKDYGKGLQISAEPIKPIDTRAELAKIAGVSHDTRPQLGRMGATVSPCSSARPSRS